jgi:hypothetical protein
MRDGRYMNFLAKLACATLAIVLAANADTEGKPSSNGESTITPFSERVTGWSAWQYILLATGTSMAAMRSRRLTSSTWTLIMAISTRRMTLQSANWRTPTSSRATAKGSSGSFGKSSGKGRGY